MLVLSRRKNESIVLNGNITVTVVEIRGDKVRLGIVAPKDASVHRQEVWEAIHGETPVFVTPPIAIDPRWLTSTVVDLARAIDAERAYDRLPILADALMDAGCDNAEIIQHCRAAGTPGHMRGCWVVDLLLGKK